MKILVINCGSSSLKYQLIDSQTEQVLAKGLCERIGIDGRLTHKPTGKDKVEKDLAMPDHTAAVGFVLDALTDPVCGVVASLKEIGAVGHRIVHGGEKFNKSVVITEDVITAGTAIRESMELLGGLDIIVNAAGIQRRHPCEEFPLEDWNDVIEVNMTAPFELSQLAAKEYLKKEKPYGKIINFASMLSFFGGFTVPAYAASKGGVAQFSKGMTNELAGKGININCIAPGYMDTEMNTALTDPANPRYKEITDRIPAHRWGTPDDVKGLAIFLSSHASDYINGAVIPCDGGYLVK